MNEDNDLLIGVKEISVYMHRCPRTITTMLANGSIPAGKIGGRWEASKSEIDDYKAQSRKVAQKRARDRYTY